MGVDFFYYVGWGELLGFLTILNFSDGGRTYHIFKGLE